jgi:disulfide bond formation protein DsbB
MAHLSVKSALLPLATGRPDAKKGHSSENGTPMTLSRLNLVLLALLGSAAVLASAFAFEYLGGLQPCTLCWWQRYPHMVAIAIGLVALIWRPRALLWLGAAAALTTAGIGAFHVGVEQGWWEGLSTCSGASISGLSVDDLLDPDADIAAPVRCDAIAWSMWGISMAGWNALFSLGLAGLWLAAAQRRDQAG